MKETIKAIIAHIIQNRLELGKDKFTGVHRIENYLGTGEASYRIYKRAFIPSALDNLSETNKCIAEVIAEAPFDCKVEWDAQSLWLTVSK